jgi:hypothetical protein
MEYIKYIDLGENKMNRRDEKGSVLVLVLIGVLVISILGISGLTKSTTEISVSRNFNDDKIALFTANSGINYGINELRNTIDPQSVQFQISDTEYFSSFKSGKITDSTPQNVTGFLSFTPPPPSGVSLEIGGEAGVSLTAWNLIVSSHVSIPTRGEARKQIQSAVVLLSSEY